MIVSGSSFVTAPPAELWAVLSDPARLAEALPGVLEISIEDERRFSAVANPVTALGETVLSMDFEIVEQRPFEYVRIDGSGSAGENLVELSVALSLAPEGAGTAASWTAELALRGVLRSLLARGAASLFNDQVEAVLAAGSRLAPRGS